MGKCANIIESNLLRENYHGIFYVTYLICSPVYSTLPIFEKKNNPKLAKIDTQAVTSALVIEKVGKVKILPRVKLLICTYIYVHMTK